MPWETWYGARGPRRRWTQPDEYPGGRSWQQLPTCRACGQPMTRFYPGQQTHPGCHDQQPDPTNF